MEVNMKNTTYSKVVSLVILAAMLLCMLPLTSFSIASEAISETISISSLDEMLEENSPELAQVVAFAEGQITGYGSNGKFLAPIEDPDPNAIEIRTAQQLYNVRNNLSGSFVLMNDIDLSGFNGGQWVPIGDDSVKFTGTFDGQGYVIKNLRITGGAYEYNGLFGYSSGGAEIKNIGLDNLLINTSSTSFTSGGLCGCGSASYISNCYNDGGISSSSWSSYAGGICGISSGSISYCYNTGNISSFGNTGGISGNGSGSISNCYNTGSFSSSGNTGGICGSGYGFISNCYNTGKISSSSYYTGGICGFGDTSFTISISNCINTGDISSGFAGGICGASHRTDSISNCYNTGNISSTSANSTSAAGGICAVSYSTGPISDCYNTGDISSFSSYYDGETWAGGICGICSNPISNCYTTGSISSTNSSTYLDSPSHAGGICGSNINSNYSSISNCIILSGSINANNTRIPTNITSYLVSDGGSKANNLAFIGIYGNAIDDATRRISLTEAKSQSTYENDLGWDFRTAWKMVPGYDFPQLRWNLNDDDCLSSLSINTGELDQAFNPEQTSYTVSVPYSVSSITIEATPSYSEAEVFGTGEKALNVGANLFLIIVTAENGITTRTYTVTVSRAEPDNDATLSSLKVTDGNLVPVFDSNVFHYRMSVPTNINHIGIAAAPNHPAAGISGDLGVLPLFVGDNTFKVTVTAQSGKQQTYTIVVTRGEVQTPPVYIRENTGNIGTIGRVVFEMPDDKDFLDNYALVCDEDIDAEIYFSPKRTENAKAAGKNTYVFAIRLPNGETREDISFSFKPVGGAVEKNKIIIYGDVNDDGFITTTDATLVTRWAGGNTATPLRNILAADVNGDAYITTTDATLITRKAGGIDSVVFSIETKF
jgi:hypothetical protein